MQAPTLPSGEAARIATLRDPSILDTDPEEKFDALTVHACSQFDVAIALVSLVDVNRHWFKSRCGLNADETGRDISFCGHAIPGDDLIVIDNTVKDERFADNPLATGAPHIRFYAGCPLKMANASNIGTFRLIDRRPRTLDAWEAQHLRDLAWVTALQIQGIDAIGKWRRSRIASWQAKLRRCRIDAAALAHSLQPQGAAMAARYREPDHAPQLPSALRAFSASGTPGCARCVSGSPSATRARPSTASRRRPGARPESRRTSGSTAGRRVSSRRSPG